MTETSHLSLLPNIGIRKDKFKRSNNTFYNDYAQLLMLNLKFMQECVISTYLRSHIYALDRRSRFNRLTLLFYSRIFVYGIISRMLAD